MLRNTWEFEHTAAKLAEAAGERRRHHVARRDWWERKKADVMQRIRTSGLDIQESVAARGDEMASFTRGAKARIRVDATMQRDLDECSNKISHHRNMVELYGGWRQVLQGNPEARLKLQHDDYLFFYGAPPEPEPTGNAR